MAQRFVLPIAPEDSDDVVIALETARVHEERSDPAEAAKWLQRAAAAARQQGRPERAGQLSRAAASIVRTPAPPAAGTKFEKRPDEEHVLVDADEFSDETIVDSVTKLRQQDRAESKTILAGGTPVAPLAGLRSVPTHGALRVAVRRALGGRFEARPLSDGERAASGEEEALLVPLTSGSNLF